MLFLLYPNKTENRMKKHILLVATVLISFFSIAQETFPTNGTSNPNHSTYAFVNAKIIVDADVSYDNGNIDYSRWTY